MSAKFPRGGGGGGGAGPFLARSLKIKFHHVCWKHGSSVVRHLPLVLEIPGLIPARGEENFGVRTYFL